MTKKTLVSAALLATLAALPVHGSAAAMRQYTIVDPVLAMPAWTLAVPAGWSADGTMLPGTSCSGATTPVYKVTSPDGRTGAYFLPRVDWAWGPGARTGKDCLPWTRQVSAREFLRYQIGIEKAAFVAEEPVPPASPMGYGATLDQARGLVRYTVGSRAYDAIIEASVVCRSGNVAALGEMHLCSGLVRKWFGPAGTVVPNVHAFEAMRLTLNPEWMARWKAAMEEHSIALSRQQTQALLRQGDLAQAARMQEHQQFMASMQHEADVRTGNFVLGQYRKQNNNDNFVDYVLDCQRYYNASGTVRVSGGNCPNRQTF
jgi:hypothetical protein